MPKHLALIAVFLWLSAPLASRAQTAPPAQPQPQPPAAAPNPAPAEPAKAAYSYQVEGRRDPFVSLLGRGLDPKTANRGTGLASMLINETSVKGILKTRDGYAAFLQGPDNRTYPARPGDRLLDGTVKAVNADSVVFSQDVNDPLSVVKQREIIKKVRSTEEGRE